MTYFRFLVLLLLVAHITGCATGGPGHFYGGNARALTWSPDGKVIVAVRDQALVIHDAKTLKPITTHESSESYSIRKLAASAAFSPNGKVLATAGFEGGVSFWDSATWQRTRKLQASEGTTTVAFTPDGLKFISAGPQAPLRLWDVDTGSLIASFADAPSGTMSVAVSPDGRLLATGEINQQVRLWKLPSREITEIVKDYSGPVLSVAFSPDSSLLASFAGGTEARLLKIDDFTEMNKLIDPLNPTPEQKTTEAIGSILSIFAIASTIHVSGGPGVLVPFTGFENQTWPPFNCPITFSPDGKLLALIRFSREIGSGSYHIEVYDSATGNRVSRYNGAMSSVAFSPDNQRLATSGFLQVILIDPRTGEEISMPP